MGDFISGLFGGSTRATEEAKRQQDLSRVAQLRQEQTAQDQKAETARQLSGAGKAVRGNRLLIAPEAGGLADKLGG